MSTSAAKIQLPGRWVVDAACARATPTMAIPIGVGPGQQRRVRSHIERARAVCARCPVLDECRAWALSSPDPAFAMVAGALTPEERARLRAGESG